MLTMIIGIGFNSKSMTMVFLPFTSMMIVEHVNFLFSFLFLIDLFAVISFCFLFTAQIPSYVIQGWNINGLFVGDTRRLSSDLFQPFLGYMADLVFNDEHLFTRFRSEKDRLKTSEFESNSENLFIGYRVAFFHLVTIETSTSYIAFSERESQYKNHGKLDIYFLFRSYVPDGIILYRYAQGLNEYFAIGLRAGILAVFIDFGFGKRQIVSDESSKLADGKWHEVRVTRLGTDK